MNKDDEKKQIEKFSKDLKDYHLIKLLGKGTFSFVDLVEHQKEIYALKKMNKLFLLKEQQINHVKEEKSILESLEHPFIIKLYFVFQDDANLYFIYEFVQGGELFTRIRECHSFPNDVALFYTSEILLAIQFLHSKSVIYRDLKPENILIDENGHIKLIDFGFAKRQKPEERSYTLCGTPEYMAPEILERANGYGIAADYWALGIFIYEMLFGLPPFLDKEPFAIYEKIIKNEIKFPKNVKSSAKELIIKLLDKNPKTRLGANDMGEEIKKQTWFKNLDWNDIFLKKISTPWKPVLNDAKDTNYFSEYDKNKFEEGRQIPEEFQFFYKDF